MRERTTWDRNVIASRVKNADDPSVLNNPEHLKAQPSADDYVIGDPSTFAEDVHPSGGNWKAEYGAGGTTKRNEIGEPEMRGDTFNHPEKAPGSSPGRGSKSAALSEETVVKKADLCVKVARSMLGNASDQVIEDQAVALMDLPDTTLIQTVNRLDGVVQAAQQKQENDDDSDDDDGDKKQAAQQKQQNDDDSDEDKKSNQQQDKKQAAQQKQQNDDGDEDEKKQAGKVPPQFLENIKKKKEEAKDDKKEAAQQDDDDKKSNQQQDKKKQANQQLQAVQQQITALQQQLQNMMEQQGNQDQMQVQQNQQQDPMQVQQNQQPVQPMQQQGQQQVQQNQDEDGQLLDQMLAQQQQDQGQDQQMFAGDSTEIQIEGAQMDVGETNLGPEDEVLSQLFASSPEVMQAQQALALTTGVPYQPPQTQVRQASQGFVRTAATRTVGTHPSGGVSQLGAAPAAEGAAGGGEIDKLSNLWNSAPDVSQVFNPTY